MPTATMTTITPTSPQPPPTTTTTRGLETSLTEVAIVVVLDELAVVDRSDPQLPLHGGDERRALEERSRQSRHRPFHGTPRLVSVAPHGAVGEREGGGEGRVTGIGFPTFSRMAE